MFSLSPISGMLPVLPVVFAQGPWIMAFYAAQLIIATVLLWFERKRSVRHPRPKRFHEQPLPLAA